MFSVANPRNLLITVILILGILGTLYFTFTTNYTVNSFPFKQPISEAQTAVAKPSKTGLSDQELIFLQSLSVPDRLKVDGTLLKSLLIPRVSGTRSNRRIQKFLKNHFRKLHWNIEEDRFNDITPVGVKTFNNLIMSKNPKASKKLIFAAHFDSKSFGKEQFIGAIDSAVSCAILMDIALTLDTLLLNSGRPEVGLEMVFLDGEEAVVSWSVTDSVYGARHLADQWSKTMLPNGSNATRIEAIELFVLLDLIGVKGSTIWNLQYSTTSTFEKLAELENRLKNLSLLTNSMTANSSDGYFRSQLYGGYIDDDHRPFLDKGVPIVHLIPAIFPDVWHQLTDNADAIDHDMMVDFSLIMRAFIAEYLQLLL